MDNQTFVKFKNSFKSATGKDADSNIEMFMQYISIIHQREQNTYLKHVSGTLDLIQETLKTISQKK